MAELSEKDKLTLWGANYKEVLAQAEARDGAEARSARSSAEKLSKLNNRQFSAFAFMVVGALLFISNFFAVSGPSVMLVGVVGIAAFLLGGGWFVHLWRSIRELRA